MILAYQYKITGKPEDYVVSFPDIPEALTGGATKQEAHELARDCLLEALDGYMKANEAIPVPTKHPGALVYLRPVEAAKVALYNAMKDATMTRVALADKMGVNLRIVQRWLELTHNSKIEDINNALRLVFGLRLITSVEKAA